MIIKGRVIKYGDNVDTDVIIPARYLNTTDGKELAQHCFEDLDSNFKNKKVDSSIIVAEENFGCGSSREHAPLAIRGSGMKLVIAKSFARIFFRNSINIGLPLIQAPEAVENILDGDELEVDLDNGIIKNLSNDKSFKINPFPEFIQEIINNEGYIKYIKSKIKTVNN